MVLGSLTERYRCVVVLLRGIHHTQVSYSCGEGTMLVDAETIKSLELISNIRTGSTEHSLFGVINHTKTSAGGR